MTHSAQGYCYKNLTFRSFRGVRGLLTGLSCTGKVIMALDSEYGTDWKNKHKGVTPRRPKLVE